MDIAWFLHALDNAAGREIVREFEEAATESRFPVTPVVTWAQPGEFEEHTLNKARTWSRTRRDGAVLYTHTKGAYRPDEAQKPWREVMIDRLLRAWPARLANLAEHDVAGVWWLTPEKHSAHVTVPYFPGNFWWARSDFLAELPELSRLTDTTRSEAETWLGKASPRAYFMSEEWPNFTQL